jgi:hypothetical protein
VPLVLECIESPEFCFGGGSDGTRTYLLPLLIALIEQEFDERHPEVLFVARFVPHNVVSPSRSAWSTSRMEMCSQAEQLTHNVGVVDALDDDVKHFALLFKMAGDDNAGISGNHVRYDTPE